MKMKIPNKIKDWYKNPPKRSFWFYIAVMLALNHYFLSKIHYLFVFQIGLLAPKDDLPVNLISDATQKINDALFGAFQQMYEAGQNISLNHPIVGHYLGQSIGYAFITAVLLIVGYLFHGVIRSLVNYFYNEFKQKKRKKK